MNGYFYSTVSTIKQCLDYFVSPENTKVCFMTFDQAMQFYVVPEDETKEPSILWVTDVDEPFVPFPQEKLMLNVTDDRARIDALLDRLISLYYLESRKNLPIQTCQGAAISAAT